MARHHEDRVTIIGVPSADSEENMLAFVEQHGLAHLTHAVDHDKGVWAVFGVPGQPSWGFVSSTGDVSTHVGPLYGEGLSERLAALD